MAPIKRALLSCYDKSGVVELASLLREFGVEIICTAGTLETLRKAGVEAVSLAEYTGVEEMMDGRVKSLHPKVHSGLLGIRDNKVHAEQMRAHDYEWIDFVGVNLHPLEELSRRPGVAVDEVIEQIDIGGTAMVRSAAKNFRYVTVVVNPGRYKAIMHELHAHNGEVPFTSRYRLAQEAFEYTARYDKFISDYLRRADLPKE